jgi:Arc/MetJ-type ribon-helix-helix transcriptional regulator
MVMKTLEVQLPEPVATELDALVKRGWFANENEIVRLALLEFARRNRFALIEQFQREDIAWALEQKRKKP